MLKRTELRRYMMALLWSDAVPQNADCDVGSLWLNCNNERIDVFDHETHQIFEDVEDSYGLKQRDAVIIFNFESVIYDMSPTEMNMTSFRLNIDIVANEASGRKRQDILDVIEERIHYRFLSYQTFIDATTTLPLHSFMRQLNRNGLKIETRDDSSFNGNNTLRQMIVSFSTKDCIRRPACEDVPLCLDLDFITRLDTDCNPS